MKSLISRNLPAEWEKAAADIYEAEQFESNFFLSRYFIESYKFNYSHLNKKIRKQTHINEEMGYIVNSVSSLIYYFVMEYFSICKTYRSYSNLVNTGSIRFKPDALMDKNIFTILFSAIDPGDPYIFMARLYQSAIDMLYEARDLKAYRKYKKLFLEYSGRLSRDEANFHTINLIAFLVVPPDKNAKGVQEELFKTYKLMLDKEYYLNSSVNHLPHEIYRNILLHALRMKKYDWTRDFILKYSKKVHPNDIRNMECYGFAYLSYYEKRFEEALKHLNEIELNYFQYKFDVKNLNVWLYFELGYFEESLSLIKSYREFLKYDKTISAGRKYHYRNFINYYEKMILLKLSSKESEIEFEKQKLEHDNRVSFKPWLIEKMTKMLKYRKKSPKQHIYKINT